MPTINVAEVNESRAVQEKLVKAHGESLDAMASARYNIEAAKVILGDVHHRMREGKDKEAVNTAMTELGTALATIIENFGKSKNQGVWDREKVKAKTESPESP